MNRLLIALGLVALVGLGDSEPARAEQAALLEARSFEHYIEGFNAADEELYPGYITNGAAWGFLRTNVPLFECPDKEIEGAYYFRWWTYRKHIKKTPDGFVITEFLPDVPWAAKDNAIVCAAGHHFYEGRWLADGKYLDDYARFWFRKGADPRQYSSWLADALWARYMVTGDGNLIKELLPDLMRNYSAWETSHLGANGLFLQSDDRDGMEMSIGGSGYRATLNSYMFGDAKAIGNIAELAGEREIAEAFRQKAEALRRLVLDQLWDKNGQFFKVLPEGEDRLVHVRELHGYTPWYFDLPDADKSAAWKQLIDPAGFGARFGLTTAERRDPQFSVSYNGHECQWNGPSWPYATSITLTAMANLLNDYKQNVVSDADYVDLLKVYARSQRLSLGDGRSVWWIDEDLNPTNGDWIARTLLRQRGSSPRERGKDYNHSTFCDLVISGLMGLRPRADDRVQINPLAPKEWDYFCLDRVRYHGRWLTILWDKTGQHYHRGKGLRLLVDGNVVAATDSLKKITARLPDARR